MREPSDQLLRDAAANIRWHVDLELGLGNLDPQEADTWQAVASWIDAERVDWLADFEQYLDRHVNYWQTQNSGAPLPLNVALHLEGVAAEYADGRHRHARTVSATFLGREAS